MDNDNDKDAFKNKIAPEEVKNDVIVEHPNGTLWIVFGYPELDYYNIYQYDDRKDIYRYNPFFLDDNPKVIIRKKNGEFKVGMTREDLYKSIVHENFKLKSN